MIDAVEVSGKDTGKPLAWSRGSSRPARCPANARIIGDSTRVPGDAQAAFAWVLREATTNIIRHSNATTCTIELGIQPHADAGPADTAVLRIHNDGAHAADPDHAPGHGLTGLRERVTTLGGQFTAGPQPDGWFTIEARLPATSNAPTAALDPAP